MEKGEIARFEQFLLLSLCFQKACCCRGVRKHLYGGERVNLYLSYQVFLNSLAVDLNGDLPGHYGNIW